MSFDALFLKENSVFGLSYTETAAFVMQCARHYFFLVSLSLFDMCLILVTVVRS